MSPAQARLAGLVAAGGPFAVALSEWPEPRPVLAAAVTAAALCLSGLLLPWRFAAAVALGAAGVAGGLVLTAPAWTASPVVALAAWLAALGLAGALWVPPRPRHRPAAVERARIARAAAATHLAVCGAALAIGGLTPRLAGGVAVSWLITLGLAWPGSARLSRGRRRGLAGAALAAGGAGLLLSDEPARAVAAAALAPAALLLLLREPRRPRLERVDWWEPVLHDPARLLVFSFFLLCALGTVVLSLPAAASSGHSLGLGVAAFTATSAACVTGLIVVDTPSAFSPLGQAAILVLIQLGGLGIMAFSTAALSLLGRRMSLRHEGAVAGLLGDRDRGRIAAAIGRLVAFTFAAEAAGGMLLAARFAQAGDPPAQAAWRGLFTAVSAFCNAGFALQTDSLAGYASDPVVLHVVAALIVLGGLSPAGVVGFVALARGRRATAQARLLLGASAFLLVSGTLAVAAFEWNGALGHLGVADRLHGAWFHSVTLRTAGFNAIDAAAVAPATFALMLVWMFVGGGPGGTAGGIKVTTAGVLLLAAVAAVRGHEAVTLFGRRVPHRTVYRAAAIATLGLVSLLAAVLALLLTQPLEPSVLLFEAVSALGTVGLSQGATAQLDEVGRAVIVACMFGGRVGPLTAFMILARRGGRDPWGLPEEDIDVG